MSKRKTRGWLEEQRATIGGNAAAAILGLNPWQGPEDVADRMTGPLAADEDNADMRRGRVLEPIARERLAEESGIKVTPHPQRVFLYDPEMPFAHALPDAWYGAPEGARAMARLRHGQEIAFPGTPVELKVPRPATWREWLASGLPDHYWIQIQHTLMVLRVETQVFAALNPETLEILRVDVRRDEIAIATLRDAEAAFFATVRAGVSVSTWAPPQIDTTAKPKGEIAPLATPAAVDAAVLLAEAMALRETAGEAYEAAKTRMLAAMDGADAVEIPVDMWRRLRIYAREQEGAARLDQKALLRDHPELRPILEVYCRRGAPTRPFRPIIMED